jgi:hypothetical protein
MLVSINESRKIPEFVRDYSSYFQEKTGISLGESLFCRLYNYLFIETPEAISSYVAILVSAKLR